MSATNLSSQLQDYLNKSGSSNSLSSKSSSNPVMQSFTSINIDSVFGMFKSQKEQQELSPDETINGWFSQAQQDPFLPTLVSYLCMLIVYVLSSLIFCNVLNYFELWKIIWNHDNQKIKSL